MSPGVEIRPAEKPRHPSLHQQPCQMPAHRSGRLLISLGFKLLAKRHRGFGQRRTRDVHTHKRFCGLGQHRPVSDSKKGHAQIFKLAAVHDRVRREARNRVVALAAGEFLKEMSGVFVPGRQLDGGQQFLRREVSLINTLEEIAGGNAPFASRTADDNGRIQRHHAGRQFGCRVRMGEAAADCTTIADRGMRDLGDGFRQQRCMRRYFWRPLQVDMTRQRADF